MREICARRAVAILVLDFFLFGLSHCRDALFLSSLSSLFFIGVWIFVFVPAWLRSRFFNDTSPAIRSTVFALPNLIELEHEENRFSQK
jgi:hypothetical protein